MEDAKAIPWVMRPLVILLVVVVVCGNAFFGWMLASESIDTVSLDSDAAASDLYPRWRGTRDLMLHGTDPYSESQTTEYERGFYGRVPAADEYPSAGRQAFFYPLHIGILLAPFILVPFQIVKLIFTMVFAVGLLWAVTTWLTLLGWPRRRVEHWIATGVVISMSPMVLLIAIQQPAAIELAALVFTAWCLSRQKYPAAGIGLVLASVKPQLAWLPILALLLWAIRDVPARKGMFAGATVAGVGALLVTMPFQPDWIIAFIDQVRLYTSDNDVISVIDVFPAGPVRIVATLAIVVATLACVFIDPPRKDDTDSTAIDIVAISVAATLILIPALVWNLALLVIPLATVIRRSREEAAVVRIPARIAIVFATVALCAGVAGGWYAIISGERPLQPAGAMVVLALAFLAVPLWISLVGERFMNLRASRAERYSSLPA